MTYERFRVKRTMFWIWFLGIDTVRYRALVWLSSKVFSRYYRILPSHLKKCRLLHAIDNMSFCYNQWKESEDKVNELYRKMTDLEQENSKLNLQLSIQGVPQYRKIIEAYGLKEEDLN